MLAWTIPAHGMQSYGSMPNTHPAAHPVDLATWQTCAPLAGAPAGAAGLEHSSLAPHRQVAEKPAAALPLLQLVGLHRQCAQAGVGGAAARCMPAAHGACVQHACITEMCRLVRSANSGHAASSSMLPELAVFKWATLP